MLISAVDVWERSKFNQQPAEAVKTTMSGPSKADRFRLCVKTLNSQIRDIAALCDDEQWAFVDVFSDDEVFAVMYGMLLIYLLLIKGYRVFFNEQKRFAQRRISALLSYYMVE